MPIHSELNGNVILTNNAIAGDIGDIHDSLAGNVINGGTFATMDATATADRIKKDYTAYARGEKLIGTYVHNWLGDDAEFVSKVWDVQSKLKTYTSFDTWSPSTTSVQIKASETATSFTGDMVNYEYLVVWYYYLVFTPVSGLTNPKALPRREAQVCCQAIFRRPNTINDILGKNFDTNVCATLATAPYYRYYNTSGNDVFTYSNTYGVYPSVTAATFSNTKADNPTINIKTPVINARCNATYFATSQKENILSLLSSLYLTGELYRVKKDTSSLRCLYDLLINDTIRDNS